MLSFASNANANLVANGSFEINSASTNEYNPSNATFNSLLSGVTAFGAREGIDLQQIGSPYGNAPLDGVWKVSPASDAGGISEAFSMALLQPLNTG